MSNSFTYQFQQIDEMLKGARSILIASHENPDADAVGSTLCLNLVLKKLNFEPFLYLPHFPSKTLSFLPGFFEIKNKISENLKFDLLFGLDYGDFRRLKLPDHIFASGLSPKNIITIDHHQGDQKGEIKVVDPQASSTCEIIYWWLKENPPTKILNDKIGNSSIQIPTFSQKGRDWIDKEIAVCLLTGIVADTGGFSHVSTGFKTLRAASDLLSKGVSLVKIVNQTLSIESNFSLIICGKVLSRIKTIPEHSLVYSWLSYQDLKNQPFSTGDPTEILDNGWATSIISKAATCNYALFLVEHEKGEIKGSLRSEPFKGKKVDQIAKKLGGGGHPYAAGFTKEGTIEEVLKKVIELIKYNAEEPVGKSGLI